MLAGVAAGVAETLDADPSLVRILWALLAILTGGVAILVYIVMAIVVPEAVDMAADAGRRRRPQAASHRASPASRRQAAPPTRADVALRRGAPPGARDAGPAIRATRA